MLLFENSTFSPHAERCMSLMKLSEFQKYIHYLLKRTMLICPTSNDSSPPSFNSSFLLLPLFFSHQWINFVFCCYFLIYPFSSFLCYYAILVLLLHLPQFIIWEINPISQHSCSSFISFGLNLSSRIWFLISSTMNYSW